MTRNGKKRLFSIIVASTLAVLNTNLSALTMQEGVLEVLRTNPIVQERLKNFNETQQDLNIAESEFYPSLDYRFSYGLNQAGHLNSYINDVNYQHYTHSLKLTQNIFNGFSSTNKIDYQKSRILAAAHHYIENANDTAFQMVGAYLDVVRSYQLYENAQENVRINEKIYQDVQSLYDTGLTTKSEMTKIFASLSLARSNLVVQQNNTLDKEFRFKRLLGRDVSVSDFSMPELNLAMPESMQRATMYAIENNPSILVSNYNIQGAEALYREKRSKFYPQIDLEVEQVYNDVKERNNGFDIPDDRLKAYVVLSWNLFKGWAHSSDMQKSRSSISKEVEIKRDLKRQTIEGLELSWSAYEMISKQLVELYQYQGYSQETLESYQSEYEMGRRTLLDLLSAQSDLVNSNTQIINAQIDKLYAQYRVYDAMGLLIKVVAGDTQEYNNVMQPSIVPFDIVKDKLPVELDVDGDGVLDSLDICDNSLLNNDILPYGCAMKDLDSDFDGVADSKDKCPDTKFGVVVDAVGCEIENQSNRFAIDKQVYVDLPTNFTENSPKKEAEIGVYAYEFEAIASKNQHTTALDKHLMYDEFEMIKRYEYLNMHEFNESQLKEMAKEIKSYEDQNITVTIIGHTQTMSDKNESAKVGLNYARGVKDSLLGYGVKEEVLVEQSRADTNRLFLETRRTIDKDINDVVAVTLYVPKKDVAEEENQENQSTQSAILDDDKDGVANELDMCPNTPLGYAVDEKGCSVKINLQALFFNDSSVIKQDSQAKILAFAKFLNEHEEYNTVITGHASHEKKTSDAYNLKLSKQRADSIKAFLVSNGVAEARISTVGKGYHEPVATNDTPEGQAQNRRIEAELINTQKQND